MIPGVYYSDIRHHVELPIYEAMPQCPCHHILLKSSCLLPLFLQGHEGKYTIYVHASREKPEHVSPLFIGRDVHSDKVMNKYFTAVITGNIRTVHSII
jgi:hypothetical protein